MIDSRPRVLLGARFGAGAVTLAAFAVACAVSVPPSGGPEDRTPPSVAGTVPTGDSAGVAADAKVAVTFSEGMTRARVERLVSIEPSVTVDKVEWDGETMILTPRGGLHPDTTYVVTIKPGFQDEHRVSADKTHRFAFATSAHIDSGRIEGTVHFRREPTKKGVVNCYVLPVDSAFSPAAARPDRQAITDENGRYALDYLPTGDRAFIVWAFEDRKGNRSFDPAEDVGLAAADTVRLRAGAPVATGVDAMIVDPDEPAVVRGRIVNATGIDTLLVSVALFSLPDTLPPSYYTFCDTTGAYEFGSVRAGRAYLLRALVDVFADSLCGTYPCGADSAQTCAEPCVTHPDTVTVEPGDRRTVSPIELGPAAKTGGAP